MHRCTFDRNTNIAVLFAWSFFEHLFFLFQLWKMYLNGVGIYFFISSETSVTNHHPFHPLAFTLYRENRRVIHDHSR